MHSSRVGCPGSSRWEHAPQDLDRAAMMDPSSWADSISRKHRRRRVSGSRVAMRAEWNDRHCDDANRRR